MPFGNSFVRDWPENRVAPRTRPCARGFLSVACVAALARFAFAARFSGPFWRGDEFPKSIGLRSREHENENATRAKMRAAMARGAVDWDRGGAIHSAGRARKPYERCEA